MPSPFENLSGPGKPLKAEPADAKEFAGLKRAGMARLQDASNTALALKAASIWATTRRNWVAPGRASLAAIDRPVNRYIVFHELLHTLDLGPAVWRVLSKCHEIRNLGEYEGDLNVDERIVADLLIAGAAVAAKLEGLVPIGTA